MNDVTRAKMAEQLRAAQGIKDIKTNAPATKVIEVVSDPVKEEQPESGITDIHIVESFPEKPVFEQCSGGSVIEPIISNLCQQVEYYKKLSEYWEQRYRAAI